MLGLFPSPPVVLAQIVEILLPLLKPLPLRLGILSFPPGHGFRCLVSLDGGPELLLSSFLIDVKFVDASLHQLKLPLLLCLDKFHLELAGRRLRLNLINEHWYLLTWRDKDLRSLHGAVSGLPETSF